MCERLPGCAHLHVWTSTAWHDCSGGGGGTSLQKSTNATTLLILQPAAFNGTSCAPQQSMQSVVLTTRLELQLLTNSAVHAGAMTGPALAGVEPGCLDPGDGGPGPLQNRSPSDDVQPTASKDAA